MNRAIDHVVRHLEQPLALDDVAAVACFSPFHFHRVFRSLVGETLHQFVKRLRLERALTVLSREPSRSLTEVAPSCGFGSSSDFSRCFKQRLGVAPSTFDIAAFRAERRRSLQGAVTDADSCHLPERLPAGENPDGFATRLRDLPARTVAYCRVLDPFAGNTASSRRPGSWWPGPSNTDGRPASGSATCGRTPASCPTSTAATTSPSRWTPRPPAASGRTVRSGASTSRPCGWPSWRYAVASTSFGHRHEHFELHIQLPIEPAGGEPPR